MTEEVRSGGRNLACFFLFFFQPIKILTPLQAELLKGERTCRRSLTCRNCKHWAHLRKMCFGMMWSGLVHWWHTVSLPSVRHIWHAFCSWFYWWKPWFYFRRFNWWQERVRGRLQQLWRPEQQEAAHDAELRGWRGPPADAARPDETEPQIDSFYAAVTLLVLENFPCILL